MEDQYYDIERRTAIKEEARMFRRKFITYEQAEIIYSISHRKLTDNVYHYDSQAKIFELGEKFVERQSERGEQDIEKDEKESLLDDLKAKKEEVAKAPKKEAVEKASKSKGGEAI